MKRIALIFLLAAFGAALYSQEEIIGQSLYDQQTNASCQNRIYYFEDGFIGATWTYGIDMPNSPDRGTGYNYFDGTVWQPWPTERIESQRSGWPSYAPLGENGELIVAHLSGADSVGLIFNKRILKGEGEWTESLFQGPPGYESIIWPRMVTGGLNHNHIYLIASTVPSSNNGPPYMGLDVALLYSKSTDEGETWDIQNQILPEMDSTEYNGFTGDCYAFAEPKENIIAFVVGSNKTDMFLMKSTDYGQTFEKTIIWDNPYDTILQPDTLYCVDGSLSVTLDMTGKAHVVFGIISTYFNNGLYINKLVDGVGYWHEEMEPFSSNINALNPEGGPGSELIPDYNLIGWAQDINGDSAVNYIMNSYSYYIFHGASSMVQIVSDEQNRLFLVYSSITENYHNGSENYRRLWMRASLNGGQTWGHFYHYDGNNPNSIYNEYTFPSCASFSDDYIYLIYQTDNEPGLNVQGQSAYTENFIHFAQIPKDEIVGIEQNSQSLKEFNVSQNFPNPFTKSTTIKVKLQKPAELKLKIVNMLGEKVYELPVKRGNVGFNTFTIQDDNLSPGIYFYTVNAGESSVTKKMIVN